MDALLGQRFNHRHAAGVTRMILNGKNISDADRAALLRYFTCARCGHPQEWHSHDDQVCLSKHPQPCAPETAPFRCLGYDCMGEGFVGGTPESRCGCSDFLEPD